MRKKQKNKIETRRDRNVWRQLFCSGISNDLKNAKRRKRNLVSAGKLTGPFKELSSQETKIFLFGKITVRFSSYALWLLCFLVCWSSLISSKQKHVSKIQGLTCFTIATVRGDSFLARFYHFQTVFLVNANFMASKNYCSSSNISCFSFSTYWGHFPLSAISFLTQQWPVLFTREIAWRPRDLLWGQIGEMCEACANLSWNSSFVNAFGN